MDATKDVERARAIAVEHLPIEVDSSLVWVAREPLTVNTAIAYAVSNDALLQRDLAIIVQRRAEISREELPENPTINGAFGIAIDGLSGAPIILQGIQNLRWLWTRPERIVAAEQSLQQSILTAANRTIEIVASVRTKHIAVSTQATAVELAKQNVLLASRALTITIAHVEAGESPVQAIDTARISMLQAEHLLQQENEMAVIAKVELLHAMGCPEKERDVEVVPMQMAQYVEYSDAVFLSHAIEKRLDLATKRALIAKRSVELGLANPPLISASVAFNENFNDRQAVLPGGSITLALDGNAKEIVADSMLQQAEFEYIDAKRNVVKEVRKLHAMFLSSTAEFDIDKKIVNSAKTSLQRATTAHEQGELDPLELIPIQRDLIKAKQHKLQSALLVTTNAILLEKAIGGSFKGISK